MIGSPEVMLLTQKMVAKALSMDVRTLRRLRSRGEFPEPDLRFGANLVYWRRETVQRAIEKWIERNRVDSMRS
jgi:predicted DNA-binding transcriptional regulator AlpA